MVSSCRSAHAATSWPAPCGVCMGELFGAPGITGGCILYAGFRWCRAFALRKIGSHANTIYTAAMMAA